MFFERLFPAPPLNVFIEFLWIYDDFAPTHSKEKLLPDGSMELIIDLRDHPKHKYDRHNLSQATPYRKYWLSGMQNEYIVIEASPGSMMGAHFRPGGAWPFFGTPLSEFSDQVIELDCVLGANATSLRDCLLAEPTPQQKLRVLEQYLLALAGDRLYPDRTVHHAIQQFMSAPVRLLIRDMAAKMGVSQKHLIHLFDQRVGMKPKQLDRIIRFQRVIQTLARTKPLAVDWSSVALDCGYYDQSHFINDFQSFSGMTPSAYMTQNWEYSNYVIVD